MERIAKRKPIGMVLAALGALLLIIAVASSGFSVIAPQTAESIADLEAAAAHGGSLYRPFVKAEFDYATFSGLYLSDDEDVPQMWVMWGFTDEGAVCFYMKADGEDIDGDGVFDSNDAPQDLWGVEYLLRAPQASLHEHSEWVLGESIGDTAAYYEMTEDEAAMLFADGVLEAGRSALATMRVAFWVGLAMVACGVVLLALPEKRAVGRGAVSGEETDGAADAAEEDETYEADAADEEDAENAEAEADEEAEDASDR